MKAKCTHKCWISCLLQSYRLELFLSGCGYLNNAFLSRQFVLQQCFALPLSECVAGLFVSIGMRGILEYERCVMHNRVSY